MYHCRINCLRELSLRGRISSRAKDAVWAGPKIVRFEVVVCAGILNIAEGTQPNAIGGICLGLMV
jgi:hypothetical protein